MGKRIAGFLGILASIATILGLGIAVYSLVQSNASGGSAPPASSTPTRSATSGTQAKGTVDLFNYTGGNVYWVGGVSYLNQSSCGPKVHLILDSLPTMPPHSSLTSIPAHIEEPGTLGNFSATCNGSSSFDYLDLASPARYEIKSNTDFTGGQDATTSHTDVQELASLRACGRMGANIFPAQGARDMDEPRSGCSPSVVVQIRCACDPWLGILSTLHQVCYPSGWSLARTFGGQVTSSTAGREDQSEIDWCGRRAEQSRHSCEG